MAIDTAQKRRSVSVIQAYFSPTPTPDAAKPIEWRQEVAWGYAGISPTPPPPVTGGGDLLLLGAGSWLIGVLWV